ncbi:MULTISPECIES: two-component system sensor histidine kinase CreC [unclassified Lentimonas]|uniref:two-component system sensor histidine kinase CreC n=1 Tax=unclassified Lentimonas TaxID=2630993 RepID=UPI001389D31C|nr:MULTISPECIES: two-component system sensor histidine kinase CreC [unclassified Lentimonas]
MSLTVRILLSLGLMALAGFACLLNPMLDRVERQYLEATEEPMVDVAEILAALLSNQPTHDLAAPEAWQLGMSSVKTRPLHAQIYNLMKEKVLMDFYITDTEGTIVYDSGELAAVGDDFSIYRDVRLTLKGEYGARSSRTDEEDPTSSVMYVGAPIMHGEEIIGVLSVYKPQRSMLLFIIETKRRLVFFGVMAMLLVLTLGWFLSRWVTHPLRRLTAYAAAVSKGERPEAPKMPGYNLRILGETTEAMREALENRKYVESYVQSLTHEMKSPVAGIRGAAELLYEDLTPEKRDLFLGNIQSESIRLQTLVDQLLALSSLENRKTLGAPVLVSLSAMVRRVVNHCESNTLQKQIVFEVVDCEADTVWGEEFLLETAISNLLQNAIDFSPAGGRIVLRISSTEEEVQLLIEDSGAGIPEFALDQIFDRFYSLPRPGSERKSSGLGLCFVREAVALHRGKLTISNRATGSGVSAELVFPLGVAH